ncbi:MAG: Gfo/Idh/MocA family oxidoreductase [Pseudomonadota bacterium]|nr:Gfo/Idh/MocA family oxidoreductase [Pseudomonadota bacterium]
MKECRVAVIGVGYLGQFHAEKFAQLPEAHLVAVCDADRARADEIAAKYHVAAAYDYHELIGKVDAVSIVVPTSLHHEVTQFFLSHNIHVLLEKPITRTVAEADDLIATARAHNVILQIGHLERFNSAIVALDNILDNPRFIECLRLAPFKPRVTDINVVLDLMIHDIEIIQSIVKSPIKDIRANGAHVLSESIDIANARIEFENGCVANVSASRVSFNTERKIRIFQHDAYLSLDLHNKTLGIYRKGTSEMFPGIPDIICDQQVFDQGDALKAECKAFLSTILDNTPVLVTGEAGRAALATAIDITRIVSAQLEAEPATANA